MPLAKIHVVAGRYDEARIAKVSAAVQAALMNTLRVPAEDFYQLIFELRPESLEKEGLVGAMAKQAGALRARHGIKVDEMYEGGEPEAPIAVKVSSLIAGCDPSRRVDRV